MKSGNRKNFFICSSLSLESCLWTFIPSSSRSLSSGVISLQKPLPSILICDAVTDVCAFSTLIVDRTHWSSLETMTISCVFHVSMTYFSILEVRFFPVHRAVPETHSLEALSHWICDVCIGNAIWSCSMTHVPSTFTYPISQSSIIMASGGRYGICFIHSSKSSKRVLTV